MDTYTITFESIAQYHLALYGLKNFNEIVDRNGDTLTLTVTARGATILDRIFGYKV